MPKRNRDALMAQSLYDMLMKMNDNLMQALYLDERPCIMTAIGEPNRNYRCKKYHPDCANCLASWLNDFPI